MKRATFSKCEKYRYDLYRDDLRSEKHEGLCLFIMLNPSTADETNDDPTIRRCISYAKKWGYEELIVVNLFSYRATDPKDLIKSESPVGEHNLKHILNAANKSNMIICAWGTKGNHLGQDKKVIKALKEKGNKLYCLRKTKDGHPSHPLYLPQNLKPTEFEL